MNPIDPQNPETGGKPEGLSIYSEYDRAILQWNKFSVRDIRGYRIYRKMALDSTFAPIALTLPDSSQFIDDGLNYNVKYSYFITVLGGDFETPGSDTVAIIPGPTFIWATDVYNRRILKISHDGAHEIAQIPVDGYPWELTLDPETNILWYTDILLNGLYTIESDFFKLVSDFPGGEPIDIVCDEKNNHVWVADETQGKIYVFNKQNEKIQELSGFQQPSCIDYFIQDGSCWVADSKAGTVTKISNTFAVKLQVKELFKPSSVTVNQNYGDFWVADSSRVIKFNLKGYVKLQIEQDVTFPTHVAIDSESGSCWVLDFSFFVNQSRLICFNEDGEKLIAISGLSWPENLFVNPYDHSCIVADSGNGRIIKIAPDGEILGQVTGYDYPHGLFVEYKRTNRND